MEPRPLNSREPTQAPATTVRHRTSHDSRRLAREVSSVLDLSDLLERSAPHFASTNFGFSVYLLNEQREKLSIAYAVGYPEEIVKHFTLKVRQGTVGTAVAEQRPILLNDVDQDPRYLAVVPGAKSQRPCRSATRTGDRRAQPAQRQARRVHGAGR